MDEIRQYLAALASPTYWAVPLVAMAAFILIERLMPAKPANWRGVRFSAAVSLLMIQLSPVLAIGPHFIVNRILEPVRELTLMWPISLNMKVLAFWFDAPPSPVDYQPSALAVVLFTLAGVLVADFFYYWFHRLQHSTFLWEQHKLHHSDADLCATTTYRGHWLEGSLQAFLVVLPLGLVFRYGPMQVFWMTAIMQAHGVFIHANLRLNLGPLTPLLVGPQLHRIHHSIEPEHRDKNFAAYFPLWDILFGTYYRPAREEFPASGVAGEPSISWREVAIGPFIAWGAALRGNLAAPLPYRTKEG